MYYTLVVFIHSLLADCWGGFKMENTLKKERIDGVAGLKKTKIGPLRIAFMLYCLVAAGAFGIEEMIPLSGPGLTITMLVIFAIIWALPICLMCSEMTALMPAEGGLYVWAKDALGEFFGFTMGWWNAICIYLANSAFVVLIVEYTSKFIPMSETQVFVLKVGIVLIFVVLNLFGLKEVSWANTFFSVIILVAFALVVIVGFANWNYNPMVPFVPEGASVVDSIGVSVCITVWMYCGYDCISSMAGEMDNPHLIPKGFKIAMPLIALSYILPTIAGIASVGQWESWGISADAVGYASVLTQNLGSAWGIVFLVVAIFSQCAIFNSYFAAGPRNFFVVADDNLCPRFLRRVSQKRGVPYWAIILLAIVTFFMMTFDFSVILLCSVPIVIMIYMLASICFLIFRKKYPVDKRGDNYVIKGGYKFAVFIAALPFFTGLIALVVNGTEYFLLGFLSIFSAIVFYLIFKWIYKGLYKKQPLKNPINPLTRLAQGDIGRIGIFIAIIGVYAIFGAIFLSWYEGSWGPEYYLETYGSGLISNFALMIKVSAIGGVAAIVLGVIMVIIGNKVDPAAKGIKTDFEEDFIKSIH
jgi:amino acid transporter